MTIAFSPEINARLECSSALPMTAAIFAHDSSIDFGKKFNHDYEISRPNSSIVGDSHGYDVARLEYDLPPPIPLDLLWYMSTKILAKGPYSPL